MAPMGGIVVCVLGVLSGDMMLYWTGRTEASASSTCRVVRFLLTPHASSDSGGLPRHAIKTIVTVRHLMGLRAAAFLTAGMRACPSGSSCWPMGELPRGPCPILRIWPTSLPDHIKAIYEHVHR